MYGAILGDMIGAPYEFDRGGKTKDFPLFSAESQFTDDTVMTIAVAEALMNSLGQPDDAVKAAVTESMQCWGSRYPHPYGGYGGRFAGWLRSSNPQPYGSYGNGSAMRVCAAGWLYDDLGKTRHAAALTAAVTHNHPEGIKGAEAAASVIYLARNDASKDEIRGYVTQEFGYDLSRTCDEIRPTYHHLESCQETVPEAITAFLEGQDYEDVIRTAVSLGGDCDTLTCIAGAMAEAYYGVPQDLVQECRDRLPADILEVVDRFNETRWEMLRPRNCVILTRQRALDKVWDVSVYDEDGEEPIGPNYFTFDKRHIYNYWPDYPDNLTPEQKWLFDDANPYWAEFRSTEAEMEQLRSEHPRWAAIDEEDEIDEETVLAITEVKFVSADC